MPFIVDFPIKNGGSFQFVFCKRLPGRVPFPSQKPTIIDPKGPAEATTSRVLLTMCLGNEGLCPVNIQKTIKKPWKIWKDPPCSMGEITINRHFGEL